MRELPASLVRIIGGVAFCVEACTCAFVGRMAAWRWQNRGGLANVAEVLLADPDVDPERRPPYVPGPEAWRVGLWLVAFTAFAIWAKGLARRSTLSHDTPWAERVGAGVDWDATLLPARVGPSVLEALPIVTLLGVLPSLLLRAAHGAWFPFLVLESVCSGLVAFALFVMVGVTSAKAARTKPDSSLRPSSTAWVRGAVTEKARCPECELSIAAARCPECGATVEVQGYRVLKLLGRREYGRTYLARRGALGGPVVLKELRLSQVPSAQVLDAFEREGRLLAKLRHPQLPAVERVFTEGTGAALRFYLVMEYFTGASLAAEVRANPLSAAQATRLLVELLQALVAVHAAGIFHRDVSPKNVVVRSGRPVGLVDFGVAAPAQPHGNHTLVGTVGYMPPEQLAGQVNATSDLYAVGVTVVHALTRLEPIDLLGPDASLAIPWGALPAQLVPVLQKLTARSVADRYQRATEALAVAQRLLNEG